MRLKTKRLARKSSTATIILRVSSESYRFKEGKHGLFTYWLLRKLKETEGEVTLGELQEHLAQYVDYTTTNRLNLSGQQPTLQVSPTLSRNWRAIPLR